MEQDFPYKSLHDYLDRVFIGRAPTENEIVEAKKQYWKVYNTRLKQIQRKKYKEVTIALEKQMWEVLLQKRSSKQSLPSVIKELLTLQLEGHSEISTRNVQDAPLIEQQLFLVIDYLEGLMYQRRLIDKESIIRLETLLQRLQQLLEEKF